jgi:hypothetical protein
VPPHNEIPLTLFPYLTRHGKRASTDLTTTDAASDEYMMPPTLPRPNITAGVRSYYIFLIIEETWKSKG